MNHVDSTFVRVEIQVMLRKRAVQCLSPQKEEFISNLFLVSKKDRGHRPAKSLKSFSAISSIQDGEPTLSKGIVAIG